jgi:hypothetical protein
MMLAGQTPPPKCFHLVHVRSAPGRAAGQDIDIESNPMQPRPPLIQYPRLHVLPNGYVLRATPERPTNAWVDETANRYPMTMALELTTQATSTWHAVAKPPKPRSYGAETWGKTSRIFIQNSKDHRCCCHFCRARITSRESSSAEGTKRHPRI